MRAILNTGLLFLSKCILASAAAALCAIGFLSSSAIAQNTLFVTGPVVQGTSGTSSSSGNTISGSSGDSRLVRVMWGERSDDPCHVLGTMRRRTGGTETDSLVDCHNKSNKRSSRQNSRRTVILDETDYLVTGVEACMNSGNNKIKGIRLIAELDRCILGEIATYQVQTSREASFRQGGIEYTLRGGSGVATRTCNTVQARFVRMAQQANCNNRWDGEVMCPSAQIVTGLRLATRAGNNGRTIVQGIAPICRGIVRP